MPKIVTKTIKATLATHSPRGLIYIHVLHPFFLWVKQTSKLDKLEVDSILLTILGFFLELTALTTRGDAYHPNSFP